MGNILNRRNFETPLEPINYSQLLSKRLNNMEEIKQADIRTENIKELLKMWRNKIDKDFSCLEDVDEFLYDNFMSEDMKLHKRIREFIENEQSIIYLSSKYCIHFKKYIK
jgi:hypothetical protein